MAGVTLHEELLTILREHSNRWMATGELAHEVNLRQIYRKRDGSVVSDFQIHGRTRNYPELFERDGPRVRAREMDAVDRAPAHPETARTVLPNGATRSEAHRSPPISRSAVGDPLEQLATDRAARIGTVAIPRAPGLYAVHGDPSVWRELGLGDPPDSRPLYVGKSEGSLAARDIGTHFESGKTGSSTLRRSLAGLLADRLGLIPMPRNPAKPGYFSNFGVEPDGDERLTRWMRERLTLATWPRPVSVSVAAAESAVLAALEPPLNLAKVSTRWSGHVSVARARMAARARTWRST